MEPRETVRRRLVSQRLVGERLNHPAEVVSWLGAVQAQEFAEAKWSVAERTRGCSDDRVEASFASGEIIRTHVLRPTWHFVARADIRWLLRLSRPRIHALNAYWYRRFELDPELLSRADGVLARSLTDGEPQSRVELADRLGGAGIEAKGLRLAYLLMHAELEEVICSGPRRGRRQTYMLLDHRAPTSQLDNLPHERALAELARRYFLSHGPATVRDFTAWSSLTVADTRMALDNIGPELDRETDENGTAWYGPPGRGGAPSTEPGAFLIPMYDETIVAYQDLRVVLAHQPPRPDLLTRAIVIEGLTHGSWKRALGGQSVVVEATLFGPLDRASMEALEEVVTRFGIYLGLRAILRATPAS